ncbi:hypothetical protein LTR46_008735 [Exophiala xenobiotica]|nr:hypothetical protein LTR46_008735 [Exophiala xenobiotica]
MGYAVWYLNKSQFAQVWRTHSASHRLRVQSTVNGSLTIRIRWIASGEVRFSSRTASPRRIACSVWNTKKIVCHAGLGKDFYWAYCPSLVAAILFSILFGLTTLLHTAQAIHYRKRFALILIMGGTWEAAGYIVRILSIYHQLNSTLYTIQTLLILLAPLWINAYIYMLLGRMIHFFLVSDSVFKIKARSITRMFVLFDITAFLIQATGGTMAGPDSSAQTQKIGMDVYVGGVGVQLGFLVVFVSLAVRFQVNLKNQSQSQSQSQNKSFITTPTTTTSNVASTRGYAAVVSDGDGDAYSHYPATTDEEQAGGREMILQADHKEGGHPYPYPDPRIAKGLLITLYVVMTLVIIRNTYRLAEYATGQNSVTITHEWFGYVFDAVPMLAASVVLNVFNPGKILQGPRSDFAEQDRARKQAKKERKVAKREAKKGCRSG